MFGDKKFVKRPERSLISETVSIDGTVNSSRPIDVAGLVKTSFFKRNCNKRNRFSFWIDRVRQS